MDVVRGDVAAGHASLGIRLGALVRRPRLDRSLAEGGAARTPASRFRARQLTGRRSRRRLAERLVRLSARAQRSQSSLGSAVPVNRVEILRCRTLLHELATELTGEDPVTPRGILRLRTLLSDGRSPVYVRSPEGALALELRHARTTLFLL